MDIERRRGISVTSTVLRFTYGDVVINLLDTPGHRDFSEDTLRVLAAADCAVMLLDAARGVEPQTLRLFEVARARGIPLITFVNKYDRPGMEPLEMLDHIESVLGLVAASRRMAGRPSRRLPRRRRSSRRRAAPLHAHRGRRRRWPARSSSTPRRPPSPTPTCGPSPRRSSRCWTRSSTTSTWTATRPGTVTPVFFGSAVSNFGVGLLLDALVDLAPAPAPRPTVGGDPRPLDAGFSALVFKVQANMDPRHRDRVAFLRICSGRFERGMRATNARTGRPFTLAHAHELFGDERAVIDVAYPGDVVGVVNAADLRVGDTLYLGDPVRFPPIPTLAPEHFVTVRNRDSTRHKQFRRGLSQLADEGVIHLLRRDASADPTPVLGGVGPLQFDVAIDRLRNEFGVSVGVDPTPWKVARRTDADSGRALSRMADVDVLHRSDGALMALFTSDVRLERVQREHPQLVLDRLMEH